MIDAEHVFKEHMGIYLGGWIDREARSVPSCEIRTNRVYAKFEQIEFRRIRYP